MKKIKNQIIIIITCLLFTLNAKSQVFKPWENGEFKGRIAWSSDGNFNDEDDWAASPVALAIFAQFGVKDKLVHFDYNNIRQQTNKEWEKIHENAILGAAKRYGYANSIFHNCRKNLDAAVNSIVKAINASSEDNPLYFVLAGPMEIPILGIQKADPKKRKYVTCISHNVWNDGYMSDWLTKLNKRDVIPLGVNWIQITDQNQFLLTTPWKKLVQDYELEPWHWMRDSKDPNVQFLWECLLSVTRADCSDAGMAHFLMTGDEESDIAKLKSLLEDKIVPKPLESRTTIRMEAENFKNIKDFEVEYIRERAASQYMSVLYSGESSGEIYTEFKEIYVPQSSKYDVEVRLFSGSDSEAEYSLYINDQLQGESWKASRPSSWQTKNIRNIPIKFGDKIGIKVKSKIPGSVKLDYIQLTDRIQKNPFTRKVTGPLDDPAALPGQIIIAGKHPGYLKYNGIPGPAYLCGPDNPETFLYDYFGFYNTRKDSGQEEMIRHMDDAGVNAFHFIIWRMKRTNMKGEGDDEHTPFIDHDPSKGLDMEVLDKWDGWLDLFEEAGVTVDFEFYDDAANLRKIGWGLDANGDLHPDEYRFLTGIVNKFKHHKNIIWSIEESSNKPPRANIPHFKKIAEVIAEADNFNHPIKQSFVVPGDPEGDYHDNASAPDDYLEDPNIGLVSWLHVHPNGDDIEAQYQEYLKYYIRDFRNFIVMTNETYRHPTNGSPNSRKYAWACAMTKMHNLNAYHYANRPGRHGVHLYEDGYIANFMEKTDFHTMWHRNDLAAGSTKWVLANPGNSYILYTYDYKENMGVIGMFQGRYDLLWLDTETGETVVQRNLQVNWGENTWKKPATIGNEIALYIKKRN